MEQQAKYRYLNIHLAVLLFGIAGLFGKLILLPAILIVLGRVFFASISLYFYLQTKGGIRLESDPRKSLSALLIMGIILAFHWYAFFHSIQLSTVALGLISFASFPLFTAFLEPIAFGEKFKSIYLVLAIIVAFGLYLIVPEFDLGNAKTKGVFWGILAGASFSVLTIMNRKYVRSISPIKIAFYQDLFACIVLLPFLFLIDFEFNLKALFLLFLLGTIFTAVAHLLFIRSLKTINSRSASIISSLEPVYGITFAILFLNEHPDLRTFIGAAVILLAVFILSYRKQ